MTLSHALDVVRQLEYSQRIHLIQAMLDDIAVEHESPPTLSPAQEAELDRRLADHEANPDDVVPWPQVKAAILARMRP